MVIMDLPLPPMLMLIVAAAGLGLFQLMLAAFASRLGGQDFRWAIGPRDEPRPLSPLAARLDRAFRNFQETFPILIALALALHLSDRGEGVLPLAGAALYIASRILFVVLYALGSRLRSLVWGVSFLALLLMFAGLFN